MKRYYSLVQTGTTADIDIYGDITSWPWDESDTSAYNLSKRLAELEGVDTINVNINSYGGEVSEGIAIYNALKRHSAKVVTRCDGFACSIASVIFMAGDERVMHDASLLMIHNAWTWASGNAAELRKQADDLETITQASKSAYMAGVNISEEELTALMDAETWISPQEALDMGFATSIEKFEAESVSQSARHSLFEMVACQKGDDPDGEDDPDDTGDADDGSDGEAGDGEEDPEEDPDGNDDGTEGDDGEKDPDDEEGGEGGKQACASFFAMAFN